MKVIITSTGTVCYLLVGGIVSKDELNESNHYIDWHSALSLGWWSWNLSKNELSESNNYTVFHLSVGDALSVSKNDWCKSNHYINPHSTASIGW